MNPPSLANPDPRPRRNRLLAAVCAALLMAPALYAPGAAARDKNIHVIDPSGVTRYDLPGYKVQRDGRIVSTKPGGNLIDFSGPQYQIKGDRIVPVHPSGITRHDQPSYKREKDGRIVPTDSVGRKRYDLPQYQIKGDKILPVTPSGRVQYDKPGLVIK